MYVPVYVIWIIALGIILDAMADGAARRRGK